MRWSGASGNGSARLRQYASATTATECSNRMGLPAALASCLSRGCRRALPVATMSAPRLRLGFIFVRELAVERADASLGQ